MQPLLPHNATVIFDAPKTDGKGGLSLKEATGLAEEVRVKEGVAHKLSDEKLKTVYACSRVREFANKLAASAASTDSVFSRLVKASGLMLWGSRSKTLKFSNGTCMQASEDAVSSSGLVS